MENLAYLINLRHFRTVYHRNSNWDAIKRIPRREMLHFSHQVPFCVLQETRTLYIQLFQIYILKPPKGILFLPLWILKIRLCLEWCFLRVLLNALYHFYIWFGCVFYCALAYFTFSSFYRLINHCLFIYWLVLD